MNGKEIVRRLRDKARNIEDIDIVYVVCIVSFLLSFAILLSGISKWLGGGDVPRDGDGAVPAGIELERAADIEREAEVRIRESQSTAEDIAGELNESEAGIREAEDAASRIEGNNDRAEILIGECQSVIDGIRERGKIEAGTY